MRSTVPGAATEDTDRPLTASDTPDFAVLAMTYDALQAQTQAEQLVQLLGERWDT